MDRWPLGRRRFIRILAAAPGLALIPTIYAKASDVAAANEQAEHLHVWRGVALGADAMLQLHHPDATAANRLIAASLTEVARLERVFSLYDEHSSLCVLNRFGDLNDPPLELVELLGQSEQFSRMTAGAFDATVQPLWDLYARAFRQPRCRPAGPATHSDRGDAAARGPCGGRSSTADRIHYARAGHGHHAQRHRPGLHHRPRGGLAARERHRSFAGRDRRDPRHRGSALRAVRGPSASRTRRRGPIVASGSRSTTGRLPPPADTARSSIRPAASTISSIPRPADSGATAASQWWRRPRPTRTRCPPPSR